MSFRSMEKIRMNYFGLQHAWKNIFRILWQKQSWTLPRRKNWIMRKCIRKWNTWLHTEFPRWSMRKRQLSEAIILSLRMKNVWSQRGKKRFLHHFRWNTLICILRLKKNWQQSSALKTLSERRRQMSLKYCENQAFQRSWWWQGTASTLRQRLQEESV